MQIYEVRISHAARIDMANLRAFLDAMLSEEGAIRYANNMRDEIKMLALYADLYGKSTSLTLRQIHPEASMDICVPYRRKLCNCRPHPSCQDE